MVKTAFHVHSDWSYDGRWSLDKVSEVFMDRGYDAVMLCEHCRTFDEHRWNDYVSACLDTRSGAMLVPGIEYSDPTNTTHVPVWGLEHFIGPEPDMENLVSSLKQQNMNRFAVFAHPTRRDAWKHVTDDFLDVMNAVEIWNRKTDGFAPSRNASVFINESRKPIAALDFHSDRQRFPFVLEIEAEDDADGNGIIQALAGGRHQSTFLGKVCHGNQSWLKKATLRNAENARRVITGLKRGWR